VNVEDPAGVPVVTANLADDPYVALRSPPAAIRPLDYRLRFALHAAVLAPSVHNTQPWRFRLRGGPDPYAELLMDPTRELPVLDPAHRQLVISCGAALAAYEIGLLSCGLAPHIEVFPSDGDAACLARIRVTDLGAADPAALHLLPALRRRRSYRGAMTSAAVAAPLRELLAEAVEAHCLLYFVPQEKWLALEHLVVEAAIELSDTTDVDTETKTWTRLGERSQDGVPAANWQRTSEQAAGSPVLQRDFAQGRPLPKRRGRPTMTEIEADPMLAVLLTRTDSPLDWVDSGRGLLRLALAAESSGLALGYANQPTELPRLRDKLTALLRPTPAGFDVPQLVLRLGYPAEALPPATPRRPVQSVLLPGAGAAAVG
jgi:nitroreductase